MYDLMIVGAGPAGCSAALALANSGLKVALLDKTTFPRDKVCGDAIPGPVFKYLKQLNPVWSEELLQDGLDLRVQESRIYAPSGKWLDLKWVLPTGNARRLDFDNAILDLVKKYTSTEIIEDFAVKQIIPSQNGISAQGKKDVLNARHAILASGGQAPFMRKLRADVIDRTHHCAAVRAYIQHIEGLDPGKNEFFLLKNYLPGYFWMFPLENGWANVGFGMRSDEVSRRKVDLKKVLLDILHNEPLLRNRFASSDLSMKIHGFGLPLASREITISGPSWMAIGDAAGLIDPMQGHGIDNAVWSGIEAAKHLEKMYSGELTEVQAHQQYRQEVYKKINQPMKRAHRLVQVLNSTPHILNGLVWAGGIPLVQRMIQKSPFW